MHGSRKAGGGRRRGKKTRLSEIREPRPQACSPISAPQPSEWHDIETPDLGLQDPDRSWLWGSPLLSVQRDQSAHLSLCIDAQGQLLSRAVGDIRLLSKSSTIEAGSNISVLLDPAGATALLERVKASLSLHSQLRSVIEVRVRGKVKRLLVFVSPCHPDDDPQVGLVLLRDISQESGPSRSGFDASNWQSTVGLASGVAHRFNNLLVAILGNVGVLRLCLPPDHPDHTAIQDMELAAKEMAGLTRVLQAFAGEGRYATRPVSINELVSRALDGINPALYPAIQLVQDLHSRIPPVEADPFQVEQAVFNLVMNAVEAVADCGGIVRVATRRMNQCTSGSPGNWVCVSVEDNGPGMPEPVRARLFEPFFTTKAPGRGLGLAAVLGVARSHHGSVRVRTSHGHGTAVEFCLPVAEASSPS